MATDTGVETSDQFEATLLWMAEAPLRPGGAYLMKSAAGQANLRVDALRHRLKVDTLEELEAEAFALNEIGLAQVTLDRAAPFRPYAANRTLGGFIIVDRVTNATVGLGLIERPLRKASNIQQQSFDVAPSARAEQKGQKPAVLWFTGLSGAGKSTIANALESKLHELGKHTMTLDGDNVRHGLNRDLGFSDADRVENVRRVAEVAGLMTEAGLITLVSFISPFRAERRLARDRIDAIAGEGRFFEIFVDAPLAVAEERDVKGLYAKARAGEIKDFTGIDSPYEPPEEAEIRIDSARLDPDAAAELILERLQAAGVLEA